MAIPALVSRISAVTVYSNHALVRRVADLDVAEGSPPAAIRLSGLPLSVDDTSVTVRIEALSEGAVPVATDARVGLEVPEPDEKLPPPQDEELRQAVAEVRRIKDLLDQNEGMASRFGALEAPARPRGAYGEPPPPAPADGRLALIELRRSELERLNDEHRQLQEQLREAQQRQQQLEDRHHRATTARQAREHELRKSIIVELRYPAGQPDAGPAPCRLVAEYLVPGVCWAPTYSVRFDPDYRQAELGMRAMVCQASGEDWSAVQLTLSTASPQRWTELPELTSLRIGRRQPPPPRTGWREPPSGAELLLGDYDRARTELPRRLSDEQDVSPPEVAKTLTVATPLVGAAVGVAAATKMDDDEIALADLLDDEFAMEAEPEAYLEEDTAPPPPTMTRAPMAAMAAALPAMPSLKRKKSARRPPAGVEPFDLGSETAEAPPPAELAAPADLLSFGKLRLAGPDAAQRGALRPVASEQLYLELLANLRVEVSFDLRLVVATAYSRAAAGANQTPPSGHLVPGPWQGFDHAWTAEQPVSVPSDASFHNVPLLERPADSELRYVTVPRESQDTFRFARLGNPLPAPLPRGPADIYRGGDYLLTSQLHTVAPRAVAELGLGVEEGIKVARNTRFAEETSGLLGGTLTLEHEISIEVASNLPEAAEIEVRERLPITRDGDDAVEVDVVEVEPAWQRFEQERAPLEGAYRWCLHVPAGGSQQLRARYLVKLSAKHEIVGGNRREE